MYQGRNIKWLIARVHAPTNASEPKSSRDQSLDAETAARSLCAPLDASLDEQDFPSLLRSIDDGVVSIGGANLWQESLGGNAQTLMLAAISPADYNYDETLGTLR